MTCRYDGCEADAYIKKWQLCPKHYQRWLKENPKPKKNPICKVDTCHEKTYAKEFCQLHYGRYSRWGDPLKVRTNGPSNRKLEWLKQIEETDDCIIWPFALLAEGYGYVNLNGRQRTAHRASLLIHVGDPPASDMDAAHGPCHNRACVNPRHLSWKTRKENIHDRFRDGTLRAGKLRILKDPEDPHSPAKLTAAEVAAIRSSPLNQSELARQYGVKQNTVCDIINRKTWKNFP